MTREYFPFQAQKEKDRGISGYTDAQDQLEMISAQKGDTDEQKGQILEDMSDMVGLRYIECLIGCLNYKSARMLFSIFTMIARILGEGQLFCCC